MPAEPADLAFDAAFLMRPCLPGMQKNEPNP